jgi:large subunit ribosomal protein L22
MQFIAKTRYIKYSPYKMRPIADVVRGKDALYALGWLATYKTKRSLELKKLIQSAVANAKHLQGLEVRDLRVKELRVDQGPIVQYFKPGAMGRAMVQRRRMCHMSVILEAKTKVS